jgi:hypothetical protein
MGINKASCQQIAEITAHHAGRCEDAATTAGTIVNCIVGATLPMVGTMFSGGTLQERLLFTLVLAGACASLEGRSDECSVTVSVTPESLREALATYAKITGGDIRQYLPKSMMAFAGQRSSLH